MNYAVATATGLTDLLRIGDARFAVEITLPTALRDLACLDFGLLESGHFMHHQAVRAVVVDDVHVLRVGELLAARHLVAGLAPPLVAAEAVPLPDALQAPGYEAATRPPLLLGLKPDRARTRRGFDI